MLGIELMGNGYFDRIARLYLRLAAQIEADMVHLFRRYKDQGALTAEEAAALLREPIDRATWDMLARQIAAVKDEAQRRRLMAEMTSGSVRARLDRQQALLLDLRARCVQLAQQELPLHTEAYQQTADEAYLRTVFDTLQEAADIAGADPQTEQVPEGGQPAAPAITQPQPVVHPPAIPGQPPSAAPQEPPEPKLPSGQPIAPATRDAIDDLLAERWSGKNFSERIWANTDAMAERLADVMRENMATGRSWRRCLDEMQAFAATPGKGALYASERLLRTEQNYLANQMTLRAMRDMGVKHYRYIATLDGRTSEICQKHDGLKDPATGKLYELDKAVAGENVPPLHPNCRSTIAAVVEGAVIEGLQRAARDPVTGKTYVVPAEMTYEQWLDSLGGEQAQEYAVKRKMAQNRSSDAKQHARYRALLGKEVPKALEDFQRLKYTDSERWPFYELDYQRRNSLTKHPELRLPRAGDATAADEKFTNYLFGGTNPDGLAKGKAFESRLGYGAGNWQDLRRDILKKAAVYPVADKGTDAFGKRYEQKIVLYGPSGKPANVIVGWKHHDGKTWMTTAYIKEVD